MPAETMTLAELNEFSRAIAGLYLRSASPSFIKQEQAIFKEQAEEKHQEIRILVRARFEKSLTPFTTAKTTLDNAVTQLNTELDQLKKASEIVTTVAGVATAVDGLLSIAAGLASRAAPGA